MDFCGHTKVQQRNKMDFCGRTIVRHVNVPDYSMAQKGCQKFGTDF